MSFLQNRLFQSASRPLGRRLVALLYGIPLRHKIWCGYGLTLGISICGVLAGYAIGDYYQYQAVKYEELAHHQLALLNRLQISLLQTRTHWHELKDLHSQPTAFQQEYADFIQHRTSFQQTWAEFQAFVAAPHLSDVPTQTLQVTSLQQIQQTFAGIPERYFQQIEVALQDPDLQALQGSTLPLKDPKRSGTATVGQPEAQIQAQTTLVQPNPASLEQMPSIAQLDDLSEALVGEIQRATQTVEETKQALEAIDVLRFQLSAGSVLISLAIAIGLAIATNRAIIRPIQAVTTVAQEVTSDSNFSLQAPILTRDEIGQLAIAFNHLVQTVGHLIRELDQSKHLLEEKVAVRTEELNQKNQQLQQVLKELKAKEVQLIQNAKMLSLGQMVAGIAHEINNPITFVHANLVHVSQYTQDILTAIQLYQRQAPELTPAIQIELASLDLDFIQTDIDRLLDSMRQGTERVRNIVLTLRTFARLDEAELKRIDIHQGIESTLLMLQNRLQSTAGQPIQVIRDYGELPPIQCYAGQLNQALLEILSNGIDALERAQANGSLNPQGPWEKAIAPTHALTHAPTTHPGSDPPGALQPLPVLYIQTRCLDVEQIQIQIMDNGAGIPSSIQAQIFDPFFTTKPIGQGQGLGLAISYQILSHHGGSLYCRSELGQGSSFILELPRSCLTDSIHAIAPGG